MSVVLIRMFSLQIQDLDPLHGEIQLSETLKKIQAKAKLVRIGAVGLIELEKLKAYILSSESCGQYLSTV